MKVGKKANKAQMIESFPKMVVDVNDLGIVDNASSYKNAWHKYWRGLNFWLLDFIKVK